MHFTDSSQNEHCKPAKEHVALNLFHEHSLGTHAVEHLQQHGAQQLLGRDVGTKSSSRFIRNKLSVRVSAPRMSV
jgi:hypothetical protein